MVWHAIRDTYLSVVEALPGLVAEIDDPRRPALGTWDVAGLTGHLLRAVTTTMTYLDTPEPAGDRLPDAAAYLNAYLAWRGTDPVAADAAVADRGVAVLADVAPGDYVAAFTAAAGTNRSRLTAEPAGRLLPTRFGVMRLADYLRTRTLEATVHGVDLARALDVGWQPPEPAAVDALSLLVEVGARSGRAAALLMVLTGREGADASTAVPVLR